MSFIFFFQHYIILSNQLHFNYRFHFYFTEKSKIHFIFLRLQETKELIDKKDEDEEENEEPETEEIGEEVEEETEPKSLLLKRLIYVLYFVLWATLYFIAIKVEFGAIYFIVSGLFFVYFNTRTKPKRPGEVSAYSVFNPNCEAIDGTLNAEQFERQIRFGGLI